MIQVRSLLPKLSWVLFPALLLAAPQVRHAPGPGPAKALAGTLAVVVSGGELRATVTFSNQSARDVWLEKLGEGQAPLRSEFEIRSDDGRLVPYIGPMAKRLEYTQADFAALAPDQTSRREIRMDDRYDFPKGEKVYWATFSYLSWNPTTRKTAFRALKSVKFTYNR